VLDVVYIATLIAFFAVMVAFVRWCEHIVGKEDVVAVDQDDEDAGTGSGPTGADPEDTAATAKTPEEVTS
jgi:hypothetical protein